MKDDYLWDRTGEPDPEIEQLEQVLGTLRYQPRSLDIPAGLALGHKRAFAPRLLAIAATIAMMLLGVGLWLGMQRQPTSEVLKADNLPVPASGDNTAGSAASTTGNDSTAGVMPVDRGDKTLREVVNRPRQLAGSRRPSLKTVELTPEERQEAVAAKEQLMIALRLASSKLSFAQKKAQEINTENLTHNQHKVG